MNEPNRSFPAPDAAPPPVSARLVLLASASRVQRRMVRGHLECAGFQVIEAGDGDTALQLCREWQPDLILADWHLDGLSGVELCRAHRQMPRPSYGLFILLTTHLDRADVAQGMRAGADDFLTKPITGTELLTRLASAERVLDMHDTLSAANRQLRNALDRLGAAQEQMNLELREARKLQQALIRDRQRSFGAMRLSLLMRPAGLIGGDLVGFHEIDARTVGFHAVDVSGDGVAAALITARVSARFDALSLAPQLTPVDVVGSLNAMMLDGVATDTYLTMIYGRIDLPSGTVRLVQAGHPHPLVQRASGAVERVGQGGLPVGVLPQAGFHETVLDLAPGDRLLIMSDGITDACDARGEMLGEAGLRHILQANSRASGFGLLEAICWSASEFSTGDRPDDISGLLVEHRTPARVVSGPGAAR